MNGRLAIRVYTDSQDPEAGEDSGLQIGYDCRDAGSVEAARAEVSRILGGIPAPLLCGGRRRGLLGVLDHLRGRRLHCEPSGSATRR
jgi:hypothetical protein